MTDEITDEILYGRDESRLRVFVSSRMDGTLDAEREVARDAINSSQMHVSWTWEHDAPVGVFHSESECVKFAATSDQLVLLLATELSPVTRAEYNAAREHGAQRYVLIRHTDKQDADAKAFIYAERTHVITRNFQNLDELGTIIRDALIRSAVRAERSSQMSLRNLDSIAPARPSRFLPEDFFVIVADDPSEGMRMLVSALDLALESRDPDALSELLDAAETSMAWHIPFLGKLIAGVVALALQSVVNPTVTVDRSSFVEDSFVDSIAEDLWRGAKSDSMDERLRPLIADLLALLARVRLADGAIDTSIYQQRQAILLYEELELGLFAAVSRQNLCAALMEAGRLEEAQAEARLVEEMYAGVEDEYRLGQVLLNQAQYDLLLDDFDSAQTHLDQAALYTSSDPSGHLRTSLLGLLAMVAVKTGPPKEALKRLRSAILRARRLNDVVDERISTQNLAAYLSEQYQYRRALFWIRRAIHLANIEGDSRTISFLNHWLGMSLARLGRYEEAQVLLRQSLDQALDSGDFSQIAAARADLGASLIAQSLNRVRFGDTSAERSERFVPSRISREAVILGEAPKILNAELADEGGLLLREALEYYREIVALPAAGQVISNLATLYRAAGDDQAAARILIEWSEMEGIGVDMRTGLTRDAARLVASDPARIGDAAVLYRRAADISGEGRTGEADERRAYAWEIATAAAELSHDSPGANEVISFLREAIEMFRQLDDSMAAELENDLALAFAARHEWTKSIESLQLCVELAEAQENRVLLARALGNLGEIYRRSDDHSSAVPVLKRSADLSQQIGDVADTVEKHALISNSLLMLGEVGEARKAADEGIELAESQLLNSSAKAAALSARAAVAMVDGDLASSRNLWLGAISLGAGLSRLEDELGLLEVLARWDEWREYRHWLTRIVREARRYNLGLTAAKGIVSPGRVWLARGFPRRAAGTFAWALLMGAEEFSNITLKRLANDSQTDADAAAHKSNAEQMAEIELVKANLNVAEALTSPEINRRDREICRAAITRQIGRSAPNAMAYLNDILVFAESRMMEVQTKSVPDADSGIGVSV